MALTEQEEQGLRTMYAAFQNGKRLNNLDEAQGAVSDMRMIVQDETGETRKILVREAMENAGNPIAGRYWDETNSTPTAAGYYGTLEALKDLPQKLGLGRYLVTDARVRRKLDPNDSTKFEDGSAAALDGSMGQCMWCWNAHYYTTWKEGNYTIEAITFSPITGKKSIYVPAGGTSWLGAGVMDRTNTKLASVISTDAQYRGGANAELSLETYPSLAAAAPQRTMLGMPATVLGTRTFGQYARARGTGWEANWFVARAVVEYLPRIILGTRNIQAAFNANLDADGLMQGGLGSGVTSMPDWPAYNGTYPIIPTSVGLEMGDGTGVVSYNVMNADNTVKYAAPVPVFFGLVHAGYGHLFLGVRGLVIDAGAEETIAYVAPSLYDGYSDTSVEGLLRVAALPRVSGYIKKFSTYLLGCVPTEIGSTSATYFCDYFYTNVPDSQGLRVRLAGGNANNGTNAGSSYTNTNNAATNANANISAPQYFKKAHEKSPATWQKITYSKGAGRYVPTVPD